MSLYPIGTDVLNFLPMQVVWGVWVIVPHQRRRAVLPELHSGHPGITRMKALAHHLVWWPKLDKDVEEIVKHCDECHNHTSSGTTSSLAMAHTSVDKITHRFCRTYRR